MAAPFDYDVLDLTDDQVDAEVAVFGGLTDAVRRLNQATLRTTVDHDTVEEVRRQVEELTARLPGLRLAPGHDVAVLPTMIHRSPEALHVTW